MNPEILKYLRETSGYTIEEVAKRSNIKLEKIRAVEEGKDKFTLAQIKKLADIYKRPLAAFFSDHIQKLPDITDFRINRERKLDPSVFIARRRAWYLINKIREYSEIKSKLLTFPKEIQPDRLAKEFRKSLNIKLIKSEKPQDMLTEYKEILENALVIIIIEYPLEADDVRAFSILDDISAIVLNENDTPSIKLFSLFHEVCHLLRRSAGICSVEIEIQEREESYCNEFAAEFLVPLDDLENEIKGYEVDEKTINRLVKTYGVSKQVIMLRLLKAHYIERARYEEFKSKFEKPVQGTGIRNWEKFYLNQVGGLALQEIKKAYNRGEISLYEATSILGLKTKYAKKFIGGLEKWENRKD